MTFGPIRLFGINSRRSVARYNFHWFHWIIKMQSRTCSCQARSSMQMPPTMMWFERKKIGLAPQSRIHLPFNHVFFISFFIFLPDSFYVSLLLLCRIFISIKIQLTVRKENGDGMHCVRRMSSFRSADSRHLSISYNKHTDMDVQRERKLCLNHALYGIVGGLHAHIAHV